MSYKWNKTPKVTGLGCKNRELFDMFRASHRNPNIKKFIHNSCNGVDASFRFIEDNSQTEYEPVTNWRRIYEKDGTYSVCVSGAPDAIPGGTVTVKILSGYDPSGRFSGGAPGNMVLVPLANGGAPVFARIKDKQDSIKFQHYLVLDPVNANTTLSIKEGVGVSIYPGSLAGWDSCPDPQSNYGYDEYCYDGTIGKMVQAFCITEQEFLEDQESLVMYSVDPGYWNEDGNYVCTGDESCFFVDRIFDEMKDYFNLIATYDWFGEKVTNPTLDGEGLMGWEGVIPQIINMGCTDVLPAHLGFTFMHLRKYIELARTVWRCKTIHVIHGYGMWDYIDRIVNTMLGGKVRYIDAGSVADNPQGDTSMPKKMAWLSYNVIEYRTIRIVFTELPEWSNEQTVFTNGFNLKNSAIVYPVCMNKSCKDPIDERFVIKTLKGCSGMDGGISMGASFFGSLARRMGQPQTDRCESKMVVDMEMWRGIEVICPQNFTFMYAPKC